MSSQVWTHAKPLQAAAALAAGCGLALKLSPEASFAMVNPFELSPMMWLACFTIKTLALGGLDKTMELLLSLTKPSLLEFRVQNPKVKGLRKLQAIDYCFLFCNATVEYIFITNFLHFSYLSPDVGIYPTELTLLNTLPAFASIFVVSDFFYYFAHGFMHWAPVYPYVHKHHHRQILPKRGYLDAGNEHPIEQMFGMSCVWAALRVTLALTGLHVATLITFLGCYGVMALLNHTPYDVHFNILGIPFLNFAVSAHETHHRHPKTNFAQTFMMWDKMFGTFKEYTPGKKTAKAS